MIINPYTFGTSGGSTPSSVPTTNLRVWLESTDGVTASTVSPFNVSAWNHVQSLGTNNALSSPTSRNPSYITTGSVFVDKPYLSFQQAQEDIMSIAYNNNIDFSANGFTAYVVASINALNTLSFFLAHSNDAVLTQGWGIYYNNNYLRYFVNNWNNVANYVEIPNVALNARTLFKFTWDKTTMKASYRQLNSTVQGQKAYSGAYTNPSGYPMTIMSLSGGTYSPYDTSANVAAVLVYNGVLSSADEIQVESYLKTKYNIT